MGGTSLCRKTNEDPLRRPAFFSEQSFYSLSFDHVHVILFHSDRKTDTENKRPRVLWGINLNKNRAFGLLKRKEVNNGKNGLSEEISV